MAPVSALPRLKDGAKVLDLCAAPGGKSGQLAQLIGHSGSLLSNEVIPKRARVLVSNMERLGITNACVTSLEVSEIASLCDIPIMCGDDSLTVPMMSVGAKGVISVASNIIPAELKVMVDACAKGDFATALKYHRKYYRLFKDLFIESNPIPIKAAMAMLGMIREEYRLPLCEMAPANREKLKATLSKALGRNL